MKKIAVVGAGYVGLVTGVCFAQKDNFVIVVEKDSEKINSLLNGEVPFYEPGLDTLLAKAIQEKKIVFVKNIADALKEEPKVIFSCVGTPPFPNGSADLSYVWGAANEVGQHLNDYVLFINKSTVPVGTAIKVKKIIQEQLDNRNVDVQFDVASNPEFLKEGDALNDFLFPERVVVGVESDKAKDILKDLYSPFLSSEEKFLHMNLESAELTKYASNSMLATRISFMNQLSLLADKVGADILKVKLGMSKDSRIGPAFLNAGVGYGGSCFPKDVKALVHMGKEHGQPMTLPAEVDRINDKQRILFADKILDYYKENISGKIIGIWGLSFKPETDDIRCSPAIDIINKLLEKGAKIVAYDPVASLNIKKIFGNKIILVNHSKEVLNVADSLILLTEWKEFLGYNPKDFYSLKDKVVFDGRNCFDPVLMSNNGIKYFNVGRNKVFALEQEFGIQQDAALLNKDFKEINL